MKFLSLLLLPLCLSQPDWCQWVPLASQQYVPDCSGYVNPASYGMLWVLMWQLVIALQPLVPPLGHRQEGNTSPSAGNALQDFQKDLLWCLKPKSLESGLHHPQVDMNGI